MVYELTSDGVVVQEGRASSMASDTRIKNLGTRLSVGFFIMFLPFYRYAIPGKLVVFLS